MFQHYPFLFPTKPWKEKKFFFFLGCEGLRHKMKTSAAGWIFSHPPPHNNNNNNNNCSSSSNYSFNNNKNFNINNKNKNAFNKNNFNISSKNGSSSNNNNKDNNISINSNTFKNICLLPLILLDGLDSVELQQSDFSPGFEQPPPKKICFLSKPLFVFAFQTIDRGPRIESHWHFHF